MIVMELDPGSLLMNTDILVYHIKTPTLYIIVFLILHQFYLKQIVLQNTNILSFCLYSNNLMNFYGNKNIKNVLGLSSGSVQMEEPRTSKHLCFVLITNDVYFKEIHLINTWPITNDLLLLLLIICGNHPRLLVVFSHKILICFYLVDCLKYSYKSSNYKSPCRKCYYLCSIDIYRGNEVNPNIIYITHFLSYHALLETLGNYYMYYLQVLNIIYNVTSLFYSVVEDNPLYLHSLTYPCIKMYNILLPPCFLMLVPCIYILCDLGMCIILSAINLNKTIIIVFSNVKLMNTWPDTYNTGYSTVYLKFYSIINIKTFSSHFYRACILNIFIKSLHYGMIEFDKKKHQSMVSDQREIFSPRIMKLDLRNLSNIIIFTALLLIMYVFYVYVQFHLYILFCANVLLTTYMYMHFESYFYRSDMKRSLHTCKGNHKGGGGAFLCQTPLGVQTIH